MKITTTWLNNRQEPRNRPKERYDVTIDGRDGLMVRVYPSGSSTFRFRYTGHDGARRVMVLGEYGGKGDGLTLADAYVIHAAAQRELELGLDPIEERERRAQQKAREREEHTAAGTVADLVEQFVHRRLRAERWDDTNGQWVRDAKNRAKARKRPDEAAALLKANLVERLGTVHSRDVTRRQLIKLLDDIVDRGAPVTANRVYAMLKQLFDWAAAKDIIPASPMAGIERPGGKEVPRERKLSDDEVSAFWLGLGAAEARISQAVRLALKLILVSAQRPGEVVGAAWSEIDESRAVWTIPAERKNGREHEVPLSTLALELLRELHAVTEPHSTKKRAEPLPRSPFLLPAAHTLRKAGHPVTVRALSRALRNNIDSKTGKLFGCEPFTPHDLRRTAASIMTKIGIPRLHVEKVLNHSTGDIAEVYDRHDYGPEKRVALERWAASLADILEKRPRKVVPMRRPSRASS